ncbi:MAG: GHMP kinase [Patescibacteria group bacterium]
MIIVRAPLRISFVGGGTDLPDFYHQYPGRVISTTINKFIYLIINPKQFDNTFVMKYNIVEMVKNPSEFTHDRLRAALLDADLTKNGIEFATFAEIPARTGLGSSSSFSVALVKGLQALKGRAISKVSAAEEACRLEIELLKEPIGKQDQYAASFGGFNVFQFNQDNSVTIEPVLLDYNKSSALEKHLLLFYTGITRDASSVLVGQKALINDKFETYKKMSDSVYGFRDLVQAGDIEKLALMLHNGWLHKKSLANNISNSVIDGLYESSRAAGAWGGKILGAGGGGCLLVFAPPEKHDHIRSALAKVALEGKLSSFKEIDVKFTQSGTDILFNSHPAIKQ